MPTNVQAMREIEGAHLTKQRGDNSRASRPRDSPAALTHQFEVAQKFVWRRIVEGGL